MEKLGSPQTPRPRQGGATPLTTKRGALKLNLGCGMDKREGWVNIDAVPDVEPDLLHDLHHPLPFKDITVGEILAQDILEHFTKEEGEKLVAEISRVLKPEGLVTVRVPNIDQIIEQFADDKEVRNEFLYGTTKKTGVFGAHKVGFTAESLVTLMMKYNLQLLSLKEDQTNFVAQFKKLKNPLELRSLTLIVQTLGMGGAEVFLTDLMVSLQNKGLVIKVYTTNKQWLTMLLSHRIKGQHIPVVIDIIGNWKGLFKAFFLFPYAFFYYGWLTFIERKTDLILLSGISEKIMVSWWAHIFNRPVVWLEFGPLESVFKKFLKLPKAFYYTAKKIPQKIIVPSQHTHDRLIQDAHVSLAKLEIIPCGRNILKQEVKRKKKQKSTIVCVSRLEQGKGQDLLIQAMPIILKNVPGVQLLIVGEGDFGEVLKQKAESRKLSNNIKFLGRVEDQLQLMAEADVCVFPSVWPLEGFGLVMIEAMAMGTPIVSFNRGPANEVIKDGYNGLMAETGNVEELAKKIIQLLQDKKLREKLAKQAQQDFKEKYMMENLVDRYYEVLREGYLRNKCPLLIRGDNL